MNQQNSNYLVQQQQFLNILFPQIDSAHKVQQFHQSSLTAKSQADQKQVLLNYFNYANEDVLKNSCQFNQFKTSATSSIFSNLISNQNSFQVFQTCVRNSNIDYGHKYQEKSADFLDSDGSDDLVIKNNILKSDEVSDPQKLEENHEKNQFIHMTQIV